jgi:hypothetical protein
MLCYRFRLNECCSLCLIAISKHSTRLLVRCVVVAVLLHNLVDKRHDGDTCIHRLSARCCVVHHYLVISKHGGERYCCCCTVHTPCTELRYAHRQCTHTMYDYTVQMLYCATLFLAVDLLLLQPCITCLQLLP